MPRQSLLPDVIGNTPLLYLREASELTGCHIYGKAEFMNPGGSVKDRTALGIVRAAEQAGELQPGGVIVEGTAGNTGIGLTLGANALGYECVIVAPQNASQEKIQQLEMLGAELLLVPSVPYADSHHYIHTAERVARGRAAEEAKHDGVGHMAIATVSLYAFGFHVLTRSALVRMGLLTMGAPWATEMSHDLAGPGW